MKKTKKMMKTKTTTQTKTSRLLFDGKIWEPFSSDLVEGWIPKHTLKESSPTLRFKMAKMPINLFQQCLGFFIDVDNEYKGEGQVRLFYNPTTRQWMAWAFPQKASGLTTKELGDSEKFAQDRERIGPEWINLGTIHSHCSLNAFQSDTDESDELRQDGIHITIGKIHSEKVDIHTRMVFSGYKYASDICNHVEPPDWIINIPEAVREDVAPHAAKSSIASLRPSNYPREWFDNVEDGRYKYPNYNGYSTSPESQSVFQGMCNEDYLISLMIVDLAKQFKINDIAKLSSIWGRRLSLNLNKEEQEIVKFIHKDKEDMNFVDYDITQWFTRHVLQSVSEIENKIDPKSDDETIKELVIEAMNSIDMAPEVDDSGQVISPTVEDFEKEWRSDCNKRKKGSGSAIFKMLNQMTKMGIKVKDVDRWMKENKHLSLADLIAEDIENDQEEEKKADDDENIIADDAGSFV